MRTSSCECAACRAREPAGKLLVPVLLRVDPQALAQVRAIHRRTGVRQADLLREGVGLLLAKYREEETGS